ncbi:hypothetical protein DT075_12030 [Bacillus licheniformis]|nr:hypothetical protein DT075_12030 [Bacillus licheniformis]
MKKTVGKLLIIAGILILAGMMFNGREGFSFFGFDEESARTYHAQAEDSRVNSYAELSASSSSPFGRLEYAKEVEEELEKMRAKKTGLEKQTPAGNA